MLVGPGTAVAMPYFGTPDQDAGPSSNPLASVVHALRRRWLAIAVLGTIAACGGACAGWYLIKTQYTAVMRLIIPAGSESLLVGGPASDESGFALRKRSQAQIITGYRVLESAVALFDVTKFPNSEFRELILEDRLPYLKNCVSVSFPGDAEMMELRVRCLDRRSAEKLAEIITDEYLKQQGLEALARIELLDKLQKTHDDYTKDFRDATGKLARMKEQANSKVNAQLSPSEQAYQNELAVYFEMKREMKRQILEAELELDRLQRIEDERAKLGPDAPEEPLVSEAELDEAVQFDQESLTLGGLLDKLVASEATLAERFKGKAYETALEANRRDRARMQQRIADRRKHLRHSLEVDKRSRVSRMTPESMRTHLATLNQKYEQMGKQVPEAPASLSAEQRSGVEQSAAIAIAEMELEVLKWKMDQIERQLSVADLAAKEAAARDRKTGIRKADDKVYMMDGDDQQRKLMQSGAAGGAAFAVVAGLIILLDVRRRRLNDTGDVSDQLQINVLGTVPLLRGKGSKRLEQSARLAEAVDGVAATLLCRTAGDDHRVVMISSAMAGEGKTTLAANLATSLAAAGRRTLLLDFDLRRPMLHQVYQLPIGPGLGELLSGPDLMDYPNYIQETATDGLWLIPAGAKRQRAIAELSDARTADLFAALKEHFEFIIVDGPPVLPVVDTRLVARHADGVVLSLLRDVSELPKVRSAYQLLQSYRVRILGGVVIGASGDVYYGEPPERFSSIA